MKQFIGRSTVLFFCAFADGQHTDHRRDAKDDAEHGQHRTQLVRLHAFKANVKTFSVIHGENCLSENA